jgi:hypothetical protein
MIRREPERHTLYFEVLDAVREAKGCPLCHLEADRMRRYLDGILYEFVNDPGLRQELVQSRGFCATHAHMLLRIEGPRALGTAILYRDQVEQFLKFLQSLKEPADGHFWHRKKSAEWQGTVPCPACHLHAEQRLRYMEVVAGSLDDVEFREALEASAGLCAPHFLSALDLIRELSVRDLLLAIQEAKFADLKHDLEEFCRKNDYRFRDEGFAKEGDSWLRAVKMMVGDGGDP